MGIEVTIAVVYPMSMDYLGKIRPEIEAILGTQITNEPRTAAIGNARSCIIDVELPDNFDIRSIETQVDSRLPDVNVSVATRFRKSIWEKRRIDVAIAVTSGLAVALAIRAMQLLLGWP
ncbi:MAG: hypothetical protein OXU86_05865 [Thaumarchaeota archaeon]|nr:hypothetical protein [Nitrososphaerota archaeon]